MAENLWEKFKKNEKFGRWIGSVTGVYSFFTQTPIGIAITGAIFGLFVGGWQVLKSDFGPVAFTTSLCVFTCVVILIDQLTKKQLQADREKIEDLEASLDGLSDTVDQIWAWLNNESLEKFDSPGIERDVRQRRLDDTELASKIKGTDYYIQIPTNSSFSKKQHTTNYYSKVLGDLSTDVETLVNILVKIYAFPEDVEQIYSSEIRASQRLNWKRTNANKTGSPHSFYYPSDAIRREFSIKVPLIQKLVGQLRAMRERDAKRIERIISENTRVTA